MRHLFPVIFAVILIVIFGVVQQLFLRFFNREWWRRKGIRTSSWILPLIGIVSVIVWGYGEYTARDWLAYSGAVAAVVAFIAQVSLIISLPFSGLLHAANWFLDRFAGSNGNGRDPETFKSRRAFLKGAAAAVPLVTLSAGALGVSTAMVGARVYLKPLTIAHLPDYLEGLRILHLTDLHLRHYVTLDDVTSVLTAAEPLKPDIVLVTGDVADDLKVLPDTLSLISQLNTPLGAYACLGNHEYFRGIGEVMSIFSNSTVPLLVDEALFLERNGGNLFIGGLNDPRRMRGLNAGVFRSSLDKTLKERRSEDFVLMMSHRPDVFDIASENGVDLTLSGHTHGGQIGLGDRSLFEIAWPEAYLWGHYQRGNSHLYTSSGMGHWFPFRLGCPPEAPVIELRRS